MRLDTCVSHSSPTSGLHDAPPLGAPSAASFPAFPVSWYLFGAAREIAKRPVSRRLWDRRLVAFRCTSGQIVVLDGACCHLGADLGRGRVIDDTIECPFHNWRFGPDGRCQHIPAAAEIPEFACQQSYPVVERNGLVFVFKGAQPHFELPFFSDCRPEDLSPAAPFTTELRCPWYLVGANAFDMQHFRAAHDRRLVSTPVVECPATFARRATAAFCVASDSLRDRLTRLFAGDHVEMSITDWCGNLMFATASFRHTRSYGMVVTEPLDRSRVSVSVIVFVPRSGNALRRALLDPLHARIRRYFIREFLRSDAERLEGACYNPQSLIEADRAMADYFKWLSIVSKGQAVNSRSTV